MTLPVNHIVNCTFHDILIYWDDKKGELFIFPGPGELAIPECYCLDPGEKEDYTGWSIKK